MNSFMHFLLTRKTNSLLEVSDLFPVQPMNHYFRQQVDQAMKTVTDPVLKADLEKLRGINLVAYLDKAARRAGIPDDDLDYVVQDLLIKFLVSPGNLITGWKRDAPLSFRLKAAVKNAAISFGQRHAKRKKRRKDLPPDLPGKMPVDDVLMIQEFRDFLLKTLGDAALQVFDWRLAGNPSRDLVGSSPEIQTSYALKSLVTRIKAAAVGWGRSHPEFLVRVEKLMSGEAATMEKRFGRKDIQPVA